LLAIKVSVQEGWPGMLMALKATDPAAISISSQGGRSVVMFQGMLQLMIVVATLLTPTRVTVEGLAEITPGIQQSTSSQPVK